MIVKMKMKNRKQTDLISSPAHKDHQKDNTMQLFPTFRRETQCYDGRKGELNAFDTVIWQFSEVYRQSPGEAKAKAMPWRLFIHTKIIIIKNLRELSQPQERFAPKFKRNWEKIFFKVVFHIFLRSSSIFYFF